MSSTTQRAAHTFFASCPRGLEQVLADELQAFGITDLQVIAGGIIFQGTWEDCYRANLESRIATRILWKLNSGFYRTEDDIYALANSLAWEEYFRVEKTLRVDTTAIRSALRSIDFVSLRVKDAICDRFRNLVNERPSIDTRYPDVRVHVFLTEQECTVYLDTSGAPLWQRGFRQASVQAPIKENLAAGILKLSGWQPDMPLIDPMCGSGTFLLEAVCMAQDRAPGLSRPGFGFENLLNFQQATWLKLRQAALQRALPNQPLEIYGSDIDPQAIRATQRNLQQAGFTDVVQLSCCDLLQVNPPATPGVLVTNPPYGERIGEQEELFELYPQIGSILKKYFPGWNCYFFTADTRLPKGLGLKPSRKTPLFNGPLECRLYEVKMVAGSNRKKGNTSPA